MMPFRRVHDETGREARRDARLGWLAGLVFVIIVGGSGFYLTITAGETHRAVQGIIALQQSGKSKGAQESAQAAKAADASFEALASIESELGTIILANHLTLKGESVNCKANTKRFTVSCSLTK